METGNLTPTQLNLLKIFAYDHSEEHAREIQNVLVNYLQKKLDEESDKLWDSGVLNQEVLDRIRHEDLHAK